MGLRRRTLLKVVGSSIAGATAMKLKLRSAAGALRPPLVRDVTVIGGGASGTHAALRSKDLGSSVALLEKRGRLGGHVDTIVDPVTKTPIDIGVQVFPDTPVVRAFFARLNVPLIPVQFPSRTTIFADFRTGKVAAPDSPTDAEIGKAFGIYAQLIEGFGMGPSGPALDVGFTVAEQSAVPSDLLSPFGSFVTKYGLEALVPTVFSFGQGLGDLLSTPTLYVLKNVDLAAVRATQQGFLAVPGGTQQLYDAAERALGSDAFVSAHVLAVDRSCRDGIHVYAVTPDGLLEIVTRKLVFAFPPTAQNLRPFDLDFTEADILGQLRGRYYAAALVRLSGLPVGVALKNTGLDTPYHLAELPGIYSINPTTVEGLHSLQYCDPDEAWLPDHVVKTRIAGAVDRLRKVGTAPVTFEDFVAFTNHAPFEMMVPSHAIAAGYYAKLASLQGRNGTFYTGAAFQTNDTHLLWQFNEQLLLPRLQ